MNPRCYIVQVQGSPAGLVGETLGSTIALLQTLTGGTPLPTVVYAVEPRTLSPMPASEVNAILEIEREALN